MSTEADAGAAGADTKVDAGAADAGKTIIDAAAAGDGADNAALAAAAGAKEGDAGKAQDAAPDWRTRMAGEDKDALKRLGRFTDEGAVYKAYRALEQKLSSGELKRPLAEGASAEEVATWRKENGIPAESKEYVEKLALPNGLVLGEADKPIVAELAAVAHDSNMPPAAFNNLVSKYYEIQEAQAAQQAETDASFKTESEVALREVWQGHAYKQNLTAIQNMIAGWPEGLATEVLAGRDASGRKLGDNPAFVKQLAALALELNPAATLVPAGTTDGAKGVSDRLTEIKGWMGAPRNSPESKKYWSDEKVQAEYRQLLEAQEKMKTRAA